MSYFFLRPGESVFDKLPYDLKMHPEKESLKTWLKQKERNAYIFLTISGLMGIAFLGFVLFGPASIWDLGVSAFFLWFTPVKLKQVKAARVTDEDIDTYIASRLMNNEE